MTGERFVVGTGRCGSTLLSLLLAEHREVVSIHEFFTGLDWGRRFGPGLISGGDLADLLAAEQPVTTKVLALGYTSDEIQYPFGSPDARYAAGDPMPWLLVTMLSRLGDDPDALFDELLTWARTRPPSLLRDHYRDLFAWLTAQSAQSGQAFWIERSGSSIDYLGDLIDLYPDARFVHIHRDGLEAALSIRAHPFYRLALAILFDLFPAEGTEEEMIRHVIEVPPPASVAGRYWSDQLLRGYRHLGCLDRNQWLDVHFEDLVTSPDGELERIAAFFDLPHDPGFVERATALVRGVAPARASTLPPEDLAALTAACRPGMALLGRTDP